MAMLGFGRIGRSSDQLGIDSEGGGESCRKLRVWRPGLRERKDRKRSIQDGLRMRRADDDKAQQKHVAAAADETGRTRCG